MLKKHKNTKGLVETIDPVILDGILETSKANADCKSSKEEYQVYLRSRSSGHVMPKQDIVFYQLFKTRNYPVNYFSKISLFLYVFCFSTTAFGQNECTCKNGCMYKDTIVSQFNIEIDTGVYYGWAMNYVNPLIDTLSDKKKSAPDSTSLYLTIQRPVSNAINGVLTKRPVVIQIHGGGYKDKSSPLGESGPSSGYPSITTNVSSFAQSGYVFVSLGYRLVNDYSYLGSTKISTIQAAASYQAVQDLYRALHFLKENADTYGIDTTAFFIQGGSAGGSTTLIAALYTDNLIDSFYNKIIDPKLFGPINPFSFNRDLIKAIATKSGTIMYDLNMSTNRNLPIMFIHGTCDDQAPFNKKEVTYYPLFESGVSVTTTTFTYGARSSATRKYEAGQYYKFFEGINAGHMLLGFSEEQNEAWSQDSMRVFFHDVYYDCEQTTAEQWLFAEEDACTSSRKDTLLIKPFPIYPVYNDTLEVNDSDSIAFIWRSVPTATGYILRIGSSLDGTEAIIDTLLVTKNIAQDTLTFYIHSQDLSTGNVYWQVEALNSTGTKSDSEQSGRDRLVARFVLEKVKTRED